MLIDSSVAQQTYVEDCEVCCNPIEIKTQFFGEELVSFDASELGQ